MEPLTNDISITGSILILRGLKVMLDRDLAALYGVDTGNLNKAVSRNCNRFPSDFMFQLTPKEALALRFQFGSLKRGEHFKYLPFCFTENGVAMLSTVLRSERAIRVNIQIMRTFTKLRETLSAHRDLAVKLEELERRIVGHDGEIEHIFRTIRRLMEPPKKPPRKIGFQP